MKRRVDGVSEAVAQAAEVGLVRLASAVRRFTPGARAAMLRADLEKAESVIAALMTRHYSTRPLPPAALRLRVGMRDSAANYWAQGLHSSTRVIEVFGEQPSGPVLDWGCGCGRTSAWLAGSPGWSSAYHGCDVDSDAVDWLLQHGHCNVTVSATAPPLPYDNQYFNGVFGFSVFTHIHPAEHCAWMAELHRVTAPDARVYVTQHGEHTARTRPRIAAALRRHGWAWLERPGRSKSASFVTEAFVRDRVAGLFDVEHFAAAGYQTQDAYLLRRRP